MSESSRLHAYAPPTLTVFGDVALLTASGATGSCENGGALNGGGNCPNNTGAANPSKKI